MNPIHVYFVIDYYYGPQGGTERQLYILAQGLVARGHEVRMFVLRHTPYTEGENDFPCPIECIHIQAMSSIRSILRMWRFRRRIQRERPNAVHAYFNDSAILVPIFCKTKKTRIFTSRRDMGFWYTRPYLWALAVANKRVDRIICNSAAVAQQVLQREHIKQEQIIVIHNASTIPPGTQSVSPHAPLSRGTIAGQSTIRVCLVANLRRIKRVEDLIRAAAIVRNSIPDCTFWIVGIQLDEAYCRELRELVMQLDLSSAVSFLPETDRPTELMRQCDIGVLTSSSEGLSNTIMEYMACGLPVVCSDVGGNSELVRHGREGFLYPAGAAPDLAEYITMLAQQPELMARMGGSGIQRAEVFSPEKLINSHCQTYREINKTITM